MSLTVPGGSGVRYAEATPTVWREIYLFELDTAEVQTIRVVTGAMILETVKREMQRKPRFRPKTWRGSLETPPLPWGCIERPRGVSVWCGFAARWRRRGRSTPQEDTR